MAEKTKYEVSIAMRLHGKFASQMKRAMRGVPAANQGFKRMGRNIRRAQTGVSMMEKSMMRFEKRVMSSGKSLGRMGRSMQSSASGVASSAKLMGAALGGAATVGFGGLIKNGLSFNATMERSALSVATMFQMFDTADQFVGKTASLGEKWAKNVELARAAMQEFLILQAQTPAGARDLVTVYQGAISGLAQATDDVIRQQKLVTKVSLIAPSLDNDYKQIGADLGRILTGQAGMDVRTWKTLQSEILGAAKAAGLVSDNMQIGENFVKEFNASLSAPERLRVLEKSFSKFNTDVMKSFAVSMDGIMSTTKSKIDVISGTLTKPLFEAWKTFLVASNTETDPLFGRGAMKEWMKIAKLFGYNIGLAAKAMFESMSRGAIFIRENWESISDTVYKAFQLGALLIKAVIAKAIISMAVGAATRVAGLGVRGASAAMTGRRRMAGFLGAKRKASFVASVRRGAKRGDLAGLGPVAGKVSRIVSMISTIATVAVPAIAALALVAAGIGSVAVIGVGIAVFLVDNWKIVHKTILTGMKDGSIAIKSTIEAAMRLWFGLRAVGAAFIGADNGVGIMNSGLDAMKVAIDGISSSISFLLEVSALFFDGMASFKRSMGGLNDIYKSIDNFLGLESSPEVTAAIAASKAESQSYEDIAKRLRIAREVFDESQLKDLNLEQQKAVDKATKTLEEMFGGIGKKDKKKVPKAGVVIERMINTWDLRGQDPDRLMAAFIPKLEALQRRPTSTAEAFV